MNDEPHDEDETARLDLDADSDVPTITPTAFGRPRPRSSGRAAFETGQLVAGRYHIVRFIARGGSVRACTLVPSLESAKTSRLSSSISASGITL